MKIENEKIVCCTWDASTPITPFFFEYIQLNYLLCSASSTFDAMEGVHYVYRDAVTHVVLYS